jgi:hypothetical protein
MVYPNRIRPFLAVLAALLAPSAPATAATYYVSPAGSDSAAGTSAATSYVNSGLPRNVTYYYRVSAVNVNGTEGAPSNEASARTR